ncbi:penicillin-binding protein 1C [Lichenibacterium dinghuense]|uniref:penicillin-binding protein 1C n=1 Tax=Lichenibacterium dinghuense TaxID=2895977 RepID=UPI001EFFD949|nr:penicillin-binding protein 1C [Lichenibacterium sp. 6Y81]
MLLSAAAAGIALDRLFPIPDARLREVSTVVSDRDGAPLRMFLTRSGRWRLASTPDAVSPNYLTMLVAVEDRRFWSHPGVDPLALARALAQRVHRGRAVSGASTLTMQVARLLEPRPRTLRSKLIEALRALQIEAHWSKREILDAYLRLAPMGRNVEGIAAGSLAWFGKGPEHLSDAEAALLVALPRDPTRLRPDRFPARAAAARARVLRLALGQGAIEPAALPSALAAAVPAARLPLPALAPHLAERLARGAPADGRVATTLDAALQRGVELQLAAALADLPRPVTLAAIVADWRSGAVLARAGSADYFDARRLGAVDMTRALRSPGSALKPFIYGMAFDGLEAHPGSLLRDAAARFDDYAPHNFDGTVSGDVTAREALQRSLNLPAVTVLDRLGPVAFTERFRGAGLRLDLGTGDAAPALPIALGGVGTTLDTLVEAYMGLADGGAAVPLRERPDPAGRPGAVAAAPLFGRDAADAVTDILLGVVPPQGSGAQPGRIAFKTGTSFRFRDGWAVGFDGARAAGVWMGRADGGSCACAGASAAAVLFRLFDLLPPAPLPPRPLSAGFAGPPPAALVRLGPAGAPAAEADRPHIDFPIPGSRLLVDAGEGREVKLAASGGLRPYRWLVDGRPIDSRPFARDAAWTPQGVGFFTVSVVDASGHEDRTAVRVVAREAP